MLQIVRRTFEARKYPEGSAEREKLNEKSRTSEWMPSHKYTVEMPSGGSVSFLTKKEALDYVAFYEKKICKKS